ncbi:hypothetical protein ANN_26488 [Periplaneta americana]|uniref:proline--tRNA ligase n=1 Tax=Periplaneta americana TaxID=6978 RepID=A0ABQ8RYR4_PERAM|nr:hypothetical protein ANN_26488 [Periplaneta americana]
MAGLCEGGNEPPGSLKASVMIMVHADNQGLVLPPRVACFQVVIVPCGINAGMKDEDRKALIANCEELEQALNGVGIRVKGDYRDNYSPGWKFNHWELKGVPIRIELGPKDIKQKQVVAVRRDTGEKLTVQRDCIVADIQKLLETIHFCMLDKATKELNTHIVECKDWAEFCAGVDKSNLMLSPFCGAIDCEDLIKKDSARPPTRKTQCTETSGCDCLAQMTYAPVPSMLSSLLQGGDCNLYLNVVVETFFCQKVTWREIGAVGWMVEDLPSKLKQQIPCGVGCMRSCIVVPLVSIPQYAIRKVQDNREGLELNGLHQLVVYMDDVNMLGENPQTIRKNTGILLKASKEIGLEVNSEKTKEEAEPGAPSMGAKGLCIPFKQKKSIEATDRCIYPTCKNKPLNYTLFGRIHYRKRYALGICRCNASNDLTEMDLVDFSGPCEVCGVTERVLRCSRCRCVYYCSKEHQTQDWKEHKSFCKTHRIDKRKEDENPSLNKKIVKDTGTGDSNVNTLDTKNVENGKSECHIIDSSDNLKFDRNEGAVGWNLSPVPFKDIWESGIVNPAREVLSPLGNSESEIGEETGLSPITYEGSSETEILNAGTENLNTTLDIKTLTARRLGSNISRSRNRPKQERQFNMAPRNTNGFKAFPEISLVSGEALPPFLHRQKPDQEDMLDSICRNVIEDMDAYGVCVIENFLGPVMGMAVLGEVTSMYNKGVFKDGQLVSNRTNDLKTIRGDQITWLDGKESSCRNIGILISQVDNIIVRANKMANNGKMGDYTITGRTKVCI